MAKTVNRINGIRAVRQNGPSKHDNRKEEVRCERQRHRERESLAYRASPRLCGLDMGLEVQRGMEIAAGVAIAASHHWVHADSHCTVFVGGHSVGGMRKAALTFCTLARTSLELTAHLQQTFPKLLPLPIGWLTHFTTQHDHEHQRAF